jgi:hypothetical protein
MSQLRRRAWVPKAGNGAYLRKLRSALLERNHSDWSNYALSVWCFSSSIVKHQSIFETPL